MEMSYRKQLNDNRPYWKVLVSLVFSLIFTGLFLWLGMKFIIYFTYNISLYNEYYIYTK